MPASPPSRNKSTPSSPGSKQKSSKASAVSLPGACVAKETDTPEDTYLAKSHAPSAQELKEQRQRSLNIDKQLKSEALASKKKDTCKRVIILGTGDSGKTTVLRQLTILYGSGFSESEKMKYRQAIWKVTKDNFMRLYEALRHKNLDVRLNIPDLMVDLA
jgi:G-protein alpha subunit